MEPGGLPLPGTSAIACCKFGSNFALSDVSMGVTPWRSSVASNCRSVASMPSITPFTFGSASASISGGSAASARAKLSAMVSMSRANLVTAYWEASCFSRSVRRRVFSASASARSSRSFRSADSARNASRTASSAACGLSELAVSGAKLSLSSLIVIFQNVSGQQSAHDFSRIIHHRNDPPIIQARRAKNADHAYDLALCIGVRRRHDGRTGKAEQPVLRADEDANTIGILGQLHQPDQIVLAVDIVEQCAHAVQIGLRFQAFQQMRSTTYDQHFFVRSACAH